MSAPSNDKAPATSALAPISMDESRDLIRLEDTIQRGLGTFIEVGEALAEIRDRKLYRVAHATFAAYCKVKWNMSDRRARQLMDAAEVVADISKSGTAVQKSKRQATPLVALPLEELWTRARREDTGATSPNGQPSAKAVEAVLEARDGAPIMSAGGPEKHIAEQFELNFENEAAEAARSVATKGGQI